MNEEKITAETFVHWLNSALNNPTGAPLPGLFDIVEMLQKVELGESFTETAVREHEKLTAFMLAGFTRKEAMELVMNERSAFIHAAISGASDKE